MLRIRRIWGSKAPYVNDILFQPIAPSGTGQPYKGDLQAFRASVFAGMDHDHIGPVTHEAFSTWVTGFADVANIIGRKDAFTSTTGIAFDFWDRNGEKALSTRKVHLAISTDFRRADSDDNALPSNAEFITAGPIMVAMRRHPP